MKKSGVAAALVVLTSSIIILASVFSMADSGTKNLYPHNERTVEGHIIPIEIRAADSVNFGVITKDALRIRLQVDFIGTATHDEMIEVQHMGRQIMFEYFYEDAAVASYALASRLRLTSISFSNITVFETTDTLK